jgi:peptidoglycan biosynthesis protein MviN/MurJ (putative lipid II flippase)
VILVALLGFSGGGIEPLVWGTLIGFAFHLVSLAVPLVQKGEIEIPRFTHQSLQWTPFWQGFGIMLVGQALMSFTGIIDQFFAAHLGAGAISTLSYANRVLALILGIGAMAVSRATLPVFSRVQAQGGEQLHRVAMYWIGLLFVLGLVAMIVSWWLAPWGVKLLFERGAFTFQNTGIVTEVLRFGLLQLPFYFAGLVMVSLLVGQRKYRVVSLIGLLGLVVKIIFNTLSIPYFGVGGLMISASLMVMFSSLFLGVAVFRKRA